MPLDVIPPPGSGTPTGAAGGDLAGNYPNPSLASIGGVALTATAAEINKLHSVVAGTVSASKFLLVDTNKALDALVVAALSLGAGAGTAVTATAAELNKLASVAAGTVSASKALVVDANKRLDTLVIGTLKLGAGAGTSVTSSAADLNLLAGLAAGDGLATVSAAALAAGRISAAASFR